MSWIDNNRVLCAAIWVDDKKEYAHQPKNIRTGRVFCGYRHCSIFQQLLHLTPEIKQSEGINFIQGFLTQSNHFATRQQAASIAMRSNQLKPGTEILGCGLMSENLY